MSRLPICLLALASLAPLSASYGAQPAPTRLPAVTSTAEISGLKEDQPADESGRPEWTSARRFTTTRVYIQQAPWQIGVEQWWRIRDKRNDTVQNLFQEEISLGLPNRMQLDIYGNWTVDEHRKAHGDNIAFELRWALADWGVIPLNPTIYAEYKLANGHYGPDVYEFKLLLGTAIAPRIHWGINFAYEQEIGGARATEFAIQQGLSYSVIDGKLGIGIEMQYKNESERGERGDAINRFLIGPSLQWRPTPRMHIDLVAQWGTNRDAQNFEGFLVVGYDFGKIGGEDRYSPATGRSR